MRVTENFRAEAMGAGASTKCGGWKISGFLCTVTGSLTITDADGTTLVDALPVTAGIYTPIPLLFHTSQGGTVALTTAAGTLFV